MLCRVRDRVGGPRGSVTLGRSVLGVVACLSAFVLAVTGAGAATASSRRASGRPAAHQPANVLNRITVHNRIKARPKARKPTMPAPAPACGGESLAPKPGGGAWVCTFDDEFDASTGDPTALNRSWWVPQVTASSGYTTGNPLLSGACYVDSPNNISVSGGALHLTVRRQATPMLCGSDLTQYTSGMVSTYRTFDQTYGRFEVRALLPQTTAAGLQETFWLWPINDTLFGSFPGSGEVDFSEFYSDQSSLDIPDIHYHYNTSTVNASTNTNTATTDACQISLAQYNDYAVVWTPGSFTITINGNTCLIDNYDASGLTAPEPFNQPFFIALTQALGIGTNAFNPSTTPLPATTSIQYVRVWK
jgi:beta-glucanase (GH16 family)